jgi:excisionase family DNA binding protein
MDSQIFQTEKLLNASQVAELLSISKSMAYRLIQTGEIDSVRIGTACRVRPVDLHKYIESNLHTS